jgi:hypothetical protein
MKEMETVIAACGNDCAACPRYAAHPYEKTDEELHHTAELWMKIGYQAKSIWTSFLNSFQNWTI